MLKLTEIERLIREELLRDDAGRDVTTKALVDPKHQGEARLVARQPGVFSGEGVCAASQNIVGNSLTIELLCREGAHLESGQPLLRLKGSLSSILGFERTLLNFLAVTCGVATLTASYVEAVKGTRAVILATRKTLPGLRLLQLEAVVAGGGCIHRRSLSDGILIKDNHLMACAPDEAVRRARAKASPLHRVEIEVDSIVQLKLALEGKPDIVMLDNMSTEEVAQALKLVDGKCLVEISGGINLETIRSYAELGVDYISVGRLTHSAPAFDLSLELQEIK